MHAGGEPILSVRNLRKRFAIRGAFGRVQRYVEALDDVTFEVRPGDTLGIVGESGSGKSTIGKCLIGLHQADGGEVLFGGADLLRLPRAERRRSAAKLQYVHQDSGASLDPRWKVGRLLEEPLSVHSKMPAVERRRVAQRILAAVKLPPAFLDRYPHELSGGQQRRVGLARVLTLSPSLVVLDEPTSGLDVSVQAAVINLFQEMKDAFGLSYVFISHDLSVVRILCNRVAVMYAGRIVEAGAVEDILARPRHPYTQALLKAVPRIGGPRGGDPGDDELAAPGEPAPGGCAFRPRCPHRLPVCATQVPVPTSLPDGRTVSCFAAVRR